LLKIVEEIVNIFSGGFQSETEAEDAVAVGVHADGLNDMGDVGTTGTASGTGRNINPDFIEA
jgi:hypothetical protein